MRTFLKRIYIRLSRISSASYSIYWRAKVLSEIETDATKYLFYIISKFFFIIRVPVCVIAVMLGDALGIGTQSNNNLNSPSSAAKPSEAPSNTPSAKPSAYMVPAANNDVKKSAAPNVSVTSAVSPASMAAVQKASVSHTAINENQSLKESEHPTNTQNNAERSTATPTPKSIPAEPEVIHLDLSALREAEQAMIDDVSSLYSDSDIDQADISQLKEMHRKAKIQADTFHHIKTTLLPGYTDVNNYIRRAGDKADSFRLSQHDYRLLLNIKDRYKNMISELNRKTKDWNTQTALIREILKSHID